MTRIECEVLTDQGNNAVLRLPGRRSPGVLVQGDTLHAILEAAVEALNALDSGESEEAKAGIRDLVVQIQEMRDRYEGAMELHGLPLPY